MNNKIESIISRICAVTITAFPLAGLGRFFDLEEQKALSTFSTIDDIRSYEESFLLESYWECLLTVLLVSFAYVAIIEVIAFVLRLIAVKLVKNETSI